MKIVAVGAFVVILSALVAYLTLPEFRDDTIDQGTASSLTIMFGLAVSVAIFVAAVWCLLKVVRALWSNRHVFGRNATHRLIGLGIVAVLFPKVIVAAVVLPANFIIGIISLPQRLNETRYAASVDVAESLTVSGLYDQFASVIRLTSGELARAIDLFVNECPIASILIATGLWALVAKALAAGEDGTPPRRPSRCQLLVDGAQLFSSCFL